MSAAAERHRLPDERESYTVALTVGGYDFAVVVGRYPDGRPGEMFIYDAGAEKNVEPIAALPLLDALATAISIGLQHGAPLGTYLQKLKATRFSPDGFTGDPLFPRVSSVLDYLARKVARMEGIDLDSIAQPDPKPIDGMEEA